MGITIDDQRCVGCGLCEELLPEVFIMQNQKARVKPQAEVSEISDEIRNVASDCPAEAIDITENADA